MNIDWANVFDWMILLKCFVVGGLIFVTTGAVLGGLGLYKYVVDFAGARRYCSTYWLWL